MNTSPASSTPVRFAIAGLTHGHVDWWFRRPKRDNGDMQLVGIAEANADLVARYSAKYAIAPSLFYADLGALIDAVQPAAVMAFGSTFDHLRVVQTCAPRGVPVMVEKPLAVNSDHAAQIAALSRQHRIPVLTNYETTWYASNHEAYRLVHDEGMIGDVRKMVVHDGHWGPAEIGCPPEFLGWLTDPVLNGGGVIMDFGCYGTNLMTWLMDGMAPLSVTAITQQIKPHIYPNVDDEATILLSYPHAQGIIQASWNWPWHRKDMEVYGATGMVTAVNRTTLHIRDGLNGEERTQTLPPRATPYDDVFAYFAAVVRGDVVPPADDLSGLDNNVMVVRILDAARESARLGRAISL
ncbi:MAG: Gfo/Idh/MocA family oxidoreductase [Anaerolineae bacterium]|nr:Gfo/Idh/MocA family oxidoreductase [Anaerolineae bacterium]